MKPYTIRVSSFAAEQIAEYQAHIAEKSGFAEIAERWADLVYAAIEELQIMPRRFALAEEDNYRDYNIHRLLIGKYLALYTIDEKTKTVKVIGFRHGSRLPKTDDLPPSQ
ncbi:MAG: type II toxin-antitoxin system RelE/ParE family toxin [Pirellulales bacterium]|nr:type II toxin-antitoxin system RelE/ParE family toxin [Pirellulales bacterium]